MNYLRKKGFAPVVTKDDQKILKAAAAEIDFMGVNIIKVVYASIIRWME